MKRILLGVCGGIAAYKSAELTRLLKKNNMDTRVVMTSAATEFITALTFQALSGNPVATELLDSEQENAMGHINLARWADMILIAPATANFVAKLSHGFADDLLSTLCLAADCPIIIAPSMNQQMWHKQVTQDNIANLGKQGIRIISPEAGPQACGETGMGRMADIQTIYKTLSTPAKKPLKGYKLLITAGPTREAIDPVRFITNRSSGKMGYALVNAAIEAGAEVTLISGPVNLKPPAHCKLINIETTEQMHQAVLEKCPSHDIYIGAAAVADYRPISVSKEKIKKKAKETRLELIQNPDILKDVATMSDRPVYVVGFAAETEHLEQNALQKLTKKNIDMIAANLVGQEKGGFEHDENELNVYWQHGKACLPMTNKNQLAHQLIQLIAERINEKHTV